MRLWAVLPLLAASAAFATSLPPMELHTRAARSDRVVLAEVLSVRQEEGAPPLRVTTVKVQQELKGEGAATIELAQISRADGAWKSGVVGDASFEVGERAVLFLRCRAGRCALFGLEQGKLRLSGEQVLVPGARGEVQRLSLEQLKQKLASGGAR